MPKKQTMFLKAITDGITVYPALAAPDRILPKRTGLQVGTTDKTMVLM
jgi:hypothetical protein